MLLRIADHQGCKIAKLARIATVHRMGGNDSLRTVFIKNVAPDTQKDELRGLCEKVGPVVSVHSMTPKRQYAFVTFYDCRDAQRAITVLQGSVIRGRQLDFLKAHRQSDDCAHDPAKICSTVVVVGQQGDAANEIDIRQAFIQCGEIAGVEKRGPGRFVVRFFDLRAAHKASVLNPKIGGGQFHTSFDLDSDENVRSLRQTHDPRDGAPRPYRGEVEQRLPAGVGAPVWPQFPSMSVAPAGFGGQPQGQHQEEPGVQAVRGYAYPPGRQVQQPQVQQPQVQQYGGREMQQGYVGYQMPAGGAYGGAMPTHPPLHASGMPGQPAFPGNQYFGFQPPPFQGNQTGPASSGFAPGMPGTYQAPAPSFQGVPGVQMPQQPGYSGFAPADPSRPKFMSYANR